MKNTLERKKKKKELKLTNMLRLKFMQSHNDTDGKFY